jgi:hypothetical protein
MALRPFEHHRLLGDKRSMTVHDLEREAPECDIDAIVAAEAMLLFGPDTLPEARNRGFHACPHCRA